MKILQPCGLRSICVHMKKLREQDQEAMKLWLEAEVRWKVEDLEAKTKKNGDALRVFVQ